MTQKDFDFIETHSDRISLQDDDDHTFELDNNRWGERHLLKQLGEEEVYMVTYSVQDKTIEEICYASGKAVFNSRNDAEVFYDGLPQVIQQREFTSHLL